MHSLFMRLFILVALAVAAVTALNTHAGGLSQDEARGVQEAVMTQLVAFASDDAAGAFAATTPAVRKTVGNADRFVALVQATYPMVYRPATVVFHKPEAKGGTVLQLVEITDQRMKSWMAVFALERQPDRSWSISGCVVTENPWLSA